MTTMRFHFHAPDEHRATDLAASLQQAGFIVPDAPWEESWYGPDGRDPEPEEFYGLDAYAGYSDQHGPHRAASAENFLNTIAHGSAAGRGCALHEAETLNRDLIDYLATED